MKLKIGGLYKCVNYNPLLFKTHAIATDASVRHNSQPEIPVFGYSASECFALKKGVTFMPLRHDGPVYHGALLWQILVGGTVGWLFEMEYFEFEEVK